MTRGKKLPGDIDITKLSLGEYRDLKNFNQLMEVVSEATAKLTAPTGCNSIFLYLHKMIPYITFCIKAHKFPSLTNCWKKLAPLFLVSNYEHKLLVYCWMFFDFPLNPDYDKVLADYFVDFLIHEIKADSVTVENAQQFLSIMKASRLGLYQVILRTKNIVKCKELFTGIVINVASDAEYKPDDILLTRIVSCLGDTFSIHNPIIYPAAQKQALEDKIRQDLPFISSTSDEAEDYKQFMKLSSPYWMSYTYPENNAPMLLPNEYEAYYQETKPKNS